MYKAIIVDDEELVSKGLRKHFNWGIHNIDIIADFPDGQKAFQFLQENPVDLLITDVRMPYMDGITLAKNARELYPDIKIIFVSGYDDVGYLKKALKVDAIDYILKSIDLDELNETVSRVVSIMNAENQRKKSFADMEKLLQQSFPLLQERFLMTLIHDDIQNPELIRDQIEFFNIPLGEKISYCVLVLQIQHNYSVEISLTERERQLRSLQIQNECIEAGKQQGETICFQSKHGEYVMILSLLEEEYEETLLRVSETVRERLLKKAGISASIGISDKFQGFLLIKDAYENACNAISKRYYLEDGLPISIDKYEMDDSIKDYKERAEKNLLESLSHGESERVSEALKKLLKEIKEKFHKDDQQNLIIFLLLLPTRIITDLKVKKKSAYSNQRLILEDFLYCKDFYEQCSLILKLYTEVASQLNSMSKAPSQAIVDQVRKNIEERYQEQIAITTLAEEVYLTPTYLCVLFKQVTGSTINEYLTLTRLEKAKKLLADSHIKLYDVCYKVGYLSPSYFSRIFKKYTGISPSDFRNIALSAGEATS